MRFYFIILIGLFYFPACDMRSAKSYLEEAAQLEEQGKYGEAIELLDKAIAKDEKYLGAYINRGADKSALGDYKGAIRDYQRALEIDSNNTLAYFNIANNYKRLKQFKTSVEYYDKAIGKTGDAILYIDRKGDFDVPRHEIYYERAIAYYNLDSLKKSFSDFQYSISNGYMTGDCDQWIGYIYIKSLQQKEACDYFKRALFAGNKTAEEDIKKYCSLK